LTEWVTLPDHKPFKEGDDMVKKIKKENKEKSNIAFLPGNNRRRCDNGWMAHFAKEF
jgi:hypothetical protein